MPVPTAQPQRVVERLLGSRQREAMRAIGEFEKLAIVNHRGGVEAFHLGRDSHWKTRGVEERDRTAAAPAGTQRLPGRRHVVADGRDHSETGDRDAPLGQG
jgi:hypothetical protein